MEAPPLEVLARHQPVWNLPEAVTAGGDDMIKRFAEFFVASIRNANTRAAYAQAIKGFCHWCEGQHLSLRSVDSVAIGCYLEQHPGSLASIKLHLAAIKRLFDYFVTGGLMAYSPAAAVKGPRYRRDKGKTPVLGEEDVRKLLSAIDVATLVGLRDRALIAVMLFSMARVSPVLKLRVKDYYRAGDTWWLRYLEKGGQFLEVPASKTLRGYLDPYITAARLLGKPNAPLFAAALGTSGRFAKVGLTRQGSLQIVKRLAEKAGIPMTTCNHSFRTTGITTFRRNGGSLEHARIMAGHASMESTKIYDRYEDDVSKEEVERIWF